MRKTKIVCTIGPSSQSEKTLGRMIEAGMDIARLNFSHGTPEEHLKKYNLIRQMAVKKKKIIGLLQDLQGSKIRIGKFAEDRTVELKKGNRFVLRTDNGLGDETQVSVDYKKLPRIVNKNDKIFIDDGKIELKVESVKGNSIYCQVIIGGELSSRRGVNLPEKEVDLPGMTRRDTEDIKFGIRLGVDYIAQSFVRNPEHIFQIKRLLKLYNSSPIQVIAKIEDRKGVENIDQIIALSDGIMIARGDMGVCLDRAEVPLIQKKIIDKCNNAGKPVIVATQMLDSMINSPHPTRAEVTDVATAVLQGSDCLMLSGETAIGQYPVETVKEMAKIIEVIEKSINYDELVKTKGLLPKEGDLNEGISFAIRELAQKINAKAIIALTLTGNTARLISRFRPKAMIYAFTPNKNIAKSLLPLWGIKVFLTRIMKNVELYYEKFIEELVCQKYIGKGDLVVITSGIKRDKKLPLTSLARVVEVK